MAKAKKKIDLMTVKSREALKPTAGNNRVWQPLRQYVQVGYRPKPNGAPGNWAAKANVDGHETTTTLPTYGEFPAPERFAKAKAAAEAYYAFMAAGGRADREMTTVADACRQYAEKHLNAEGTFERRVYKDAIGKVRLDKLKLSEMKGWVKRIEEVASLVGPRKGEKRAPSTINREMVDMRAALNAVKKHIPNQEWREALLAIPNADGSRDIYLPKAMREELVANASAEIEPFARGLCLVPLRPGALAHLTVNDFNKHTRQVNIRKDKTGARKIYIGIEAAALFAEQAKGKTSAAPLFARANGAAWDKDTWKGPIKAAAIAAKLDPECGDCEEICAYTLRHSVITDLIRDKLPTSYVAKLAGTSLEQIEEHYMHFQQDDATEALDRLAF